jgi:flagellar assembly protein FliH
VSPEGIVIRGTVEGAPLELRGTSRAPAVPPLQRPAADKSAPLMAGQALQGLDASREQAQQEARTLGYEAGKVQGQKDGYEAGMKQALERAEQERHAFLENHEAGQQKLIDALAKIRQMAEAMGRQKSRFLDDAEDDMVALAFEAFCRVLGETALTQDMLKSGVLHALAHWRGKAALEVHVHPEDLPWLEEDTNLAVDVEAQRGHAIRWIASAEVALGGCMLRSSEGALDARLEVQVDAFKAMLLHTRASRRTERPA